MENVLKNPEDYGTIGLCKKNIALYATSVKKIVKCCNQPALPGVLCTEGRKRLLDQFYLNQCRIHRLPAECRKQVFRLQSAYVRQMQPCVQGDRRPDSPLYAMALRKNSAVLGQLAVRMEKPNKALKLFIRRAAGLFRRGEQGK